MKKEIKEKVNTEELKKKIRNMINQIDSILDEEKYFKDLLNKKEEFVDSIINSV